MKTENVWRYTLLGTVFSILAVLIVWQTIRIQLDAERVKKFIAQGDRYSGEWHTYYPARGMIYDRWGHLLAGNTTVFEVGADLAQVENPHSIALTLNVVLGLDYAKVKEAVSKEPSDDVVYVVLDDYVTPDKIDRLQELSDEIKKAYSSRQEMEAHSLAGLVFRPHLQRTYPENALASNILGFVGRDDKGDLRGYFGVEAKYSNLLAGQPQTVWVPSDPNRVEEVPDIPDGASLVLTIDRDIQSSMEEVVDQTLKSSGSESATIVVIEPKTGDVLALATTPRLDLNKYWRYAEVYEGATPFNRAISQAYEPGSVYKVLTMAAGLDSKAVEPSTVFVDTGVFEIGGTYIRNWNWGAWGPQDMQGCMQHSLNVCLAWIASQIGTKQFYEYMNAFGIGHLTGIELAGENPGRLKIPGDEDWYDADLGTNAFGQGVAATPLQMAVAASAIANDGKMMSPRIVRSIISDGNQYDTEVRVAGMPISKATANTLTEMLARSLESEASNALVEGYRVAGKTGTAEIPTPYGYTSYETNASFVGWGPLPDTRFLVYIWLEKPTTSIWGSEVAAPVFADVVERLVVLMDIPSDDIRNALFSQ
jgi:cell division protein FtsI/penicillin-binding protein 2